ncbi:uncharacterized protein LOC143281002 isoform X3 [Babylonia areolata]|uniref:uncharacterized protein LOC143281002 isoform X3 n=1 Tax=Babylonia areolata TaxID=304850 RepID=UPI003FD39C9D
MAWCSAVNCKNSRKKGWTLFRFPKDEDRCKKWVQNTRRADLQGKTSEYLYTNCKLCSEHFEPNQFMNPSAEKLSLVWNAVPTLFNIPNPPPKVTTKRKMPCRQDHPASSKKARTSHESQEKAAEQPVTGDGCFWPTIDHTYCIGYSSSQKNLKKPQEKEAKLKTKRCGSQKKKASHGDTIGQEDAASKTKAESVHGRPKKGSKKSTLGTKTVCQKEEVCCVEGCHSGRRKSDKSFFQFPIDTARCNKWLQNMGRQDLLGKTPFQLRSERYKVCSNHFKACYLLHAGRMVKLTRNAVPSLLKVKPHRKQPQRDKSVAGKRVKRRKLGGQGKQTKQSDQGMLPEIKVEIDWAEEPEFHCSAQSLYPPGGAMKEEMDTETDVNVFPTFSGADSIKPCSVRNQNPETHLRSSFSNENDMSLPSAGHCDVETSSTSQVVSYIKSEPVEEGEEEFLLGNRENYMDLAWHRKIMGYEETRSVDGGNKSPHKGCDSDGRVLDIKPDPDASNMFVSNWIQSVHGVNSDPVSNSELGDTSEEVNHSEHCHKSSSEPVCHKHFKRNCRTPLNSDKTIDDSEHVSGSGTETFNSNMVEDDEDMAYTVIKAEPMSDSEEQ